MPSPIEKYAMEIIAGIVLSLLCWVAYTTYQTSVLVASLQTSLGHMQMDVRDMRDGLVQQRNDGLLKLSDHERRLIGIEVQLRLSQNTSKHDDEDGGYRYGPMGR